MASFATNLIVHEALDFIQTREFRGRIPGHVVDHMVEMSELAVKTAMLECQDRAEDDFEESLEPVDGGLTRPLSKSTLGQGQESPELIKRGPLPLLT